MVIERVTFTREVNKKRRFFGLLLKETISYGVKVDFVSEDDIRIGDFASFGDPGQSFRVLSKTQREGAFEYTALSGNSLVEDTFIENFVIVVGSAYGVG